MVQIEGVYVNEKNENIDGYFKAVGVPYIARKMMAASTPKMTISKDGDEWTIITSTLVRTNSTKFKVGEKYEEQMPGGVLQNVTTLQDDKFITNSDGPDNVKTSRTYEFSTEGCLIIYNHEPSGQIAKRFFKRI